MMCSPSRHQNETDLLQRRLLSNERVRRLCMGCSHLTPALLVVGGVGFAKKRLFQLLAPIKQAVDAMMVAMLDIELASA